MKILNIDKNEKMYLRTCKEFLHVRNYVCNSIILNTSLNNPQFGVIQHDFLLSIQLKFDGGDWIVRRAFHF